MKFAAALALVAAATVVSAETNAQRLARGLPPNAPARRASPVDGECRGRVCCSLPLIPFSCPPWESFGHSRWWR